MVVKLDDGVADWLGDVVKLGVLVRLGDGCWVGLVLAVCDAIAS